MRCVLLYALVIALCACDPGGADSDTGCYELTETPARDDGKDVCQSRVCLDPEVELALGSAAMGFDDAADWSVATLEFGDARLRVTREAYDTIRALDIGEVRSGPQLGLGEATISFELAPPPSIHRHWSRVSTDVDVRRVAGGFEFSAEKSGPGGAALTIGSCDSWCVSGDFCECYCDYESPSPPTFVVHGAVEQSWDG